MSARRLSIVLDQGAKRQIRVMLETLGYQVVKLVRVRIGSLWGGDLEVGRHQLLTAEDILKASVNPDQPAPKSMLRSEAKKRAKPVARKTAGKGAKPFAAKKTARKMTKARRESLNEPPRRETKGRAAKSTRRKY
jgi:hypothetical protein